MQDIEISDAMAQLSVKRSCIDGAVFNNVKLSKASFTDVAMDGVKISDANLSDLEIENAQLGGAYIHNIGLPPAGHPMHVPGLKMRPIKMEDCMLNGSIITNCNLAGAQISDCNLAGVQITDCNLAGMEINGIPVNDMLKKWNEG